MKTLILCVPDDFDWMGTKPDTTSPAAGSREQFRYHYITYDQSNGLDLEAYGLTLSDFAGMAVFCDGVHAKTMAKDLSEKAPGIPHIVVSLEDFMGGSGLHRSAELTGLFTSDHPSDSTTYILHRNRLWRESDLLEDTNDRLGITNLVPHPGVEPCFTFSVYGLNPADRASESVGTRLPTLTH